MLGLFSCDFSSGPLIDPQFPIIRDRLITILWGIFPGMQNVIVHDRPTEYLGICIIFPVSLFSYTGAFLL